MALRTTVSPTTFKLNVKDALRKLDFPKFAEIELSNTRARMRQELEKGRNPNNEGFREYSASYKKQIDAGNVRGKAPGNHTVTLRATGRMLNSLETKQTQNGAQLFFLGQHPSGTENAQIALALEEDGREFFGFGREDEKRIEKALDKKLDEFLRAL